MRILPFPKFARNQTEASAGDWSQQEIADFYRAHRLLVENGAGIGIDRGLSDTGEPWMAFFDVSTQDVFMHVARIDGRCILVCDQLDIRLKARDIGTLITDFENSVRHHLSVRSERNSNIVIHPAARIIMSISMVFLLFKLDNSQAWAKGADARTHAATEISTTRAANGADNTPAIRAQSAFTRLLENADSPATVAVLAGIILAGELAANSRPSSEGAFNHEVAVVTHDMPHHTDSAAELSTRFFANDQVRNPDIRDVQIVHAADALREELAALAPVAYMATPDKELTTALAKVMIDQVYADAGHDFAGRMVISNQDVVQISSVAVQTAPAAVATGGVLLTQSEAPTQAQQFVTGLVGKTITETVNDVSLTGKNGTANSVQGRGPDAGTVPAPVNKITDISVASLDTIDDYAGFFLRTTLEDVKLRSALEHFMSALGGFEIEYLGGRLLIEQSSMSGLADKDIGLWTNIMADGSSISVVGQATIVDDIAGFLI